MSLSIPPSLLYSCLRQGVGESQKGAFARQAGRRRGASASCAAFVALVGHMPESSDHEEFGNSNLWFPNSCGPRGSNRLSALPTGSQWVQARPTRLSLPESAAPTINPQESLADSQTLAASIYGGQWSSIGYAAAGACRLSLPVASGCRPGRPGSACPAAYWAKKSSQSSRASSKREKGT